MKIEGDEGIEKQRIVIDKGLGLGKERDEEIELMESMYELKELGLKMMVGKQRKRLVGEMKGKEDKRKRDIGKEDN